MKSSIIFEACLTTLKDLNCVYISVCSTVLINVYIFVDGFNITGMLNASNGEIELQLDILNNTSGIVSYNIGSTFPFNEWTYCGISIYKTDRVLMKYEIHLVTKTKSGIENQMSFNAQDLTLQ